ncbi:MAG: Lpg1974 family pore-forming outer membrane protein [Pirellulaceae bacterium]
MHTRINSRLIAILLLLVGSPIAVGQYGGPMGQYGGPMSGPMRPGMSPQAMMAGAPLGSAMAQPFPGSPFNPAMGQPMMLPSAGPIGSGISPIPVFAPPGQGIRPVAAALACNSAQPGCIAGCDSAGCGCQGSCYKWSIFGDLLYLRARNAEVAFAVETNNAVAPPAVPIPVQPIGIVDPDYEPAFRFGVTHNLDNFNSVTVQYTMFESDTFNRINLVTSGFQIQSLLTHPATAQAAQGGVYADARQDISYDLIEADYRKLIRSNCNRTTHFLVGVRYANMEQQLLSNLPIAGNETVDTDIDFYGIGLRMGLEHTTNLSRGFSAFGKLHGSLLVGEWRADYDQGSNFDASVVDTAWRAGRITPVVDLEVGLGWTSKCGFWHANAGYVYSGWYNALNTNDWIDAVRRNNYTDLGSNITFDGITVRLETRF